MMTHRDHRSGTILLLIVQAWLVPCHGFAFVPRCSSVFSSAHELALTSTYSRSALSLAPVARPHSTGLFDGISTGARSGCELKMSSREELPENEESGGDMSGESGGPGPYSEEHDSGGSRFRDLLARAKKVNPASEQHGGAGARASPPMSQQERPDAAAKPRRSRPEGPPNYDNFDDWDKIGSPDLPDPPLRNEMPGMRMPQEMDDGGPRGPVPEEDDGSAAGGSRFRNMMNQARNNDERQQMGGLPAASARSPGGRAPEAPKPTFTRDEKARAVREAADRQQRLMAKARGINLDDPDLDGPALQRMRAISRAQAEATGGGYVPSSSASDDYFDQLKSDSKKKIERFKARLDGQAVPYEGEDYSTMPTAEEVQNQREPEFVPQRRTKTAFSVQNESDAYIAALSGIKVELNKNPYIEGQSTTDFIEADEHSPAAMKNRILSPPLQSSARPTGPTMSYAERLRKAREKKEQGASDESSSSAATAQPVAAEQPHSVKPAQPAPALGYAEQLKKARETNAATGGSPGEEVESQPRELPSPAVRVSPAPLSETLGSFSGGDDDTPESKMMRVMDLLTQHKIAGLNSEVQVVELRDALVETRETLRFETYGGSPPPPTSPAAAAPIPAPREPAFEAPAGTAAPPSEARSPPSSSEQGVSPATGDTKEVLRRCSALLQAHVHSSLSGKDIMALRDELGASLRIVETQIDNGGLFEDAWSVSAESEEPSASTNEQASGTIGVEDEPVPASLGGLESVGAVFAGMDVAKKPATFEPETELSGTSRDGLVAAPGDDQARGWTDGSLEAHEKTLATKGLGYLLKHRGGKGYGRGRITGVEAENMVATLAELTEVLHDEMLHI